MIKVDFSLDATVHRTFLLLLLGWARETEVRWSQIWRYFHPGASRRRDMIDSKVCLLPEFGCLVLGVGTCCANTIGRILPVHKTSASSTHTEALWCYVRQRDTLLLQTPGVTLRLPHPVHTKSGTIGGGARAIPSRAWRVEMQAL